MPQSTTEDDLRAQVLADPAVPEAVRSFLAAGARLESIRLDARGVWWHQGSAFENERLAQLFHRSLVQTANGTWLLRIGSFAYPVIVDGHGAFVIGLRPAEDPTEAYLADGTTAPFAPQALATDGDRVATLHVGGREARLVGQAWHVFTEHIDADSDGWVFVTTGGARVPLQRSS